MALIFSAFVIFSIKIFMSNTAATNIMLPLIVALVSSLGDSVVSFMVITVALCASCAMILPVSTPPNAIAFASGKLKSKDFYYYWDCCSFYRTFIYYRLIKYLLKEEIESF